MNRKQLPHKCLTCGVILDISNFTLSQSRHGHYRCDPCYRKNTRERKKRFETENREYYLNLRKRNYLRNKDTWKNYSVKNREKINVFSNEYAKKNYKSAWIYIGAVSCEICGRHGYLQQNYKYNTKTNVYGLAQYNVQHRIHRKTIATHNYPVENLAEWGLSREPIARKTIKLEKIPNYGSVTKWRDLLQRSKSKQVEQSEGSVKLSVKFANFTHFSIWKKSVDDAGVFKKPINADGEEQPWSEVNLRSPILPSIHIRFGLLLEGYLRQ